MAKKHRRQSVGKEDYRDASERRPSEDPEPVFPRRPRRPSYGKQPYRNRSETLSSEDPTLVISKRRRRRSHGEQKFQPDAESASPVDPEPTMPRKVRKVSIGRKTYLPSPVSPQSDDTQPSIVRTRSKHTRGQASRRTSSSSPSSLLEDLPHEQDRMGSGSSPTRGSFQQYQNEDVNLRYPDLVACNQSVSDAATPRSMVERVSSFDDSDDSLPDYESSSDGVDKQRLIFRPGGGREQTLRFSVGSDGSPEDNALQFVSYSHMRTATSSASSPTISAAPVNTTAVQGGNRLHPTMSMLAGSKMRATRSAGPSSTIEEDNLQAAPTRKRRRSSTTLPPKKRKKARLWKKSSSHDPHISERAMESIRRIAGNPLPSADDTIKTKVPGKIIPKPAPEPVAKQGPPAYKATDDKFAASYYEIQNAILGLAAEHLDYEIDASAQANWLSKLSKTFTPELTAVINWVGSCGGKGKAGWVEIFTNPGLRVVLVTGVINKVLREYVFDELLFGSTEEQTVQLEEKEMKNVKTMPDGFDRTLARAKLCRKWLLNSPDAGGRRTVRFPENFRIACTELTASLYELLLPLIHLNPAFVHDVSQTESPTKITDKTTPIPLADALYLIVRKAGCLAIRIRLASDVIYHFEPCFKEQRFEEDTMQDVRDVIPSLAAKFDAEETQLREKERTDFAKLPFVKKVPAWFDRKRLLISMVGGEALVAYRRGGWAEEDRMKGFRRRVLVPALVLTRFAHERAISSGPDRNGKKGGARKKSEQGQTSDGEREDEGQADRGHEQINNDRSLDDGFRFLRYVEGKVVLMGRGGPEDEHKGGIVDILD